MSSIPAICEQGYRHPGNVITLGDTKYSIIGHKSVADSGLSSNSAIADIVTNIPNFEQIRISFFLSLMSANSYETRGTDNAEI